MKPLIFLFMLALLALVSCTKQANEAPLPPKGIEGGWVTTNQNAYKAVLSGSPLSSGATNQAFLRINKNGTAYFSFTGAGCSEASTTVPFFFLDRGTSLELTLPPSQLLLSFFCGEAIPAQSSKRVAYGIPGFLAASYTLSTDRNSLVVDYGDGPIAYSRLY